MSNNYFENCEDDTEPIKDFLGSIVKVGDRGIRVDINRPHYPFKKFTVKEIDVDRRYDQIKILIDGSSRMSRASGDQIITQKSISVNL